MKPLEEIYKTPETYLDEDASSIPNNYTGWTMLVDNDGTNDKTKYYKVYSHYVNDLRQAVNDEPSYIEMLAGYPDKIFCIEWHLNGLNHRINGPAVIYHTEEQEFHLNGTLLSPEDYFCHPEVIKHKLHSILDT